MKKDTKQDAPSKATEPKQMEASKTPPAAVGTPATNAIRVCWAAKTLVNEFLDLFPETPVEYSAPDGRNTMLDVTFDTTAVDDADREAAENLLELVRTDARVGFVHVESGSVLVSFKSSARTQDNRDSFGLADAWDVLTDGEVSDDEYEVTTFDPARFDMIIGEPHEPDDDELRNHFGGSL